jgi:hypothetical protein
MTDALTLSAAKVIAAGSAGSAGSAGDGRLRATVIFTPPTGVSEHNPKVVDVARSLKTWPRSAIEWLHGRSFKISLEVRSADGLAPSSTEAHCIEATASGMDSVWRSASNYSWVENLWARMFTCTGNDMQIWESLRAVLLQATSQQSTDPVAPDTVKAVPQTDLSTIFEYNRVLELCDSIGTVTELQRDCRVRERQIEVQYLPNGTTADAQNKSERDLTSRISLALQLQELIKRYQEANAPENKEAAAASVAVASSAPGGPAAAPPENKPDPAEEARTAHLRQVFYSLQSSPTLSRLFGLAIDVSFPAADLKLRPDKQFFYLSVCADKNLFEGVRHPIYILTQYRGGDSTSFWPATQEEQKLASGTKASSDSALPTKPGSKLDSSSDRPSLRQYRGIAVNRKSVQSSDTARFELSSLDVRRAAEAAIDRQFILTPEPTPEQKKALEEERQNAQRCLLSNPADSSGMTDDCKGSHVKLEDLTCKMTAKDLERLIAQSPLRPAALARKTYHTGGVTILDCDRGGQAETQKAFGDEHKSLVAGSALVLGANDLVTGYRVDVGVAVPDKASAGSVREGGGSCQFQWRSLAARRVVYGSSHDPTSQIEHVAPRLFIEDPAAKDVEMGWRRSLEDGYLGLTARVIDKTAHAEEAIFSWTAEPMGALTSGSQADKVLADPLNCGRRVIAPTAASDPDRRIPPLRFGAHYRFALRAVYGGGISLPLGVARNLYNDCNSNLHDDCDAKPPLVIPAAQCALPMSFRRFLRHERIDAPLLLLPEEVALRSHGPMGYESAAHAVIRTVRGDVHNRQQPTVTQRIFVAPGVSHSLAAMHGVFDSCSHARPPEGLSAPRFGPSGVLRDPLRGGFPMIVTDHITGINGYPYPAGRHTASSALGDAAEAGDMLYSFRPHKPPKRDGREYVAYYPDPAARKFAIGVRFAGTDTYLRGDPRVIDAQAGGYQYPDTRPLLLTVLRAPAGKPRTKIPQVEDIVTVPTDPHYLTLRSHNSARVPGAVEALLWLAPGDDFEVDVWCIPSVDDLAGRFALLESLAALSLCSGKKSCSDEKLPCQPSQQPADANWFLAGLAKLIPRFHDDVKAAVTAGTSDLKEDCNQSAMGPGNLIVPGPKFRKALGCSLVKLVEKYPLDEIAAFRTLRATHAIDKPWDDPQLDPHAPEHVSLERQAAQADNLYPWIPQGMIQFNWPTTSSLELRAAMASPSSDRLDDVRRGRSMAERRLGSWPKDSDGNALCPLKVYGFEVAPDGEVKLPKTESVPLYRLDDLPLFDREAFEDGHDTIPASLSLREQFDPKTQARGVGTGKYMFQFTDGLARQLLLTVTAYARHRDRMRTADPDAHNGKWLHQGAPLTADQSSRTSKPVPVWLKASVRPAEPAARTPFPLFRLQADPDQQQSGSRRRKQVNNGHRISRTVVVRIPIARPWFSSGEDERLGIVLWPPHFFAQQPDDLKTNRVWLETPAKDRNAGQSNKRWITLDDFRDEDLGPGGKFITRWGGDPTRFPSEKLKNTGTHPSLIPPSAFVDLDQQSATGFTPEKICRVLMPIRVEDDKNGPQTSVGNTVTPTDRTTPQPAKADNAIATLAVSLLAFRPKFDIAEEQWYVDLALEHPYEAEPFVRFGLVRYQPQAEEDLQVSFPVVQWTQLLPRRRVDVQKTGLCVTIRIEGLATSPHSSVMLDRLKDDPSLSQDPHENMPASRMVVRIVRETRVSLDVPISTIECEEAFCEKEISFAQAEQGSYQAVWRKEVQLKRFDPAHASYSVIVEERDLRLPATYRDEPVSPLQATGRSSEDAIDETLLLQSGLRFSAKIRLD